MYLSLSRVKLGGSRRAAKELEPTSRGASPCTQLLEFMHPQGQPAACSLLAELGPLVAKAMDTQGAVAQVSIFGQVEEFL